MKIFKTLFCISVSDWSDESSQVEHDNTPDFSDDSGQVKCDNSLNAVVGTTNHLPNTKGSMLRFDAISLELS